MQSSDGGPWGADDQDDHLFSTLFEAALDAMVIADDQGCYVAANRAAGDLFGLPTSELVGRHIADFTPPETDLDQAWQQFQHQGRERGEFVLLRADGTQRRVEYAATANILPHRHLSVLRDITEPTQLRHQLNQLTQRLEQQVAQRTAELEQANAQLRLLNQQLEASQKKYQTLFEILPVGVSITDAEGHMIEVNAAAAQLLGPPVDSAENSLPVDFQGRMVGPDGSPMVVADYASVRSLREQRVIKGQSQGIVCPDGSMRWLSVSAAPIPLADYGVAIAYLDVTEKTRIESQFQEISRSSPGIIYILVEQPDGAGYFDYISETVEEIYEVTVEQALADASLIVRAAHPEDQAEYDAAVAAGLETVQPFAHEWRLVTPSGVVKWLRGTSRPLRQANGTVAWHGVIFDISDRKRLELGLAESQAQMAAMLNSVQAVIVQFDLWADGTAVHSYYSPMCQVVYGYTPEEMLQDSQLWRSRVVPEDFAQSLEPVMRAIFAGQREARVEYRFRHRDGTIRWIEETATAQHDPHRDCWTVITVAIDISDRKRAEAALVESEERLRLALDAAGMGTWDWNLETNQVIWSQSLERLMGMKPGSFDGRADTVKALIHPEDRPLVMAAIARSIEQGDDYDIEFRFVRPDGRIRWVVSKGEVLRSTEGKPLRMVGVDLDITDRKAAEVALQQREALLDLFFSQSLDGFFVMLLDEPLDWAGAGDREAALDYAFTHQRLTRVNDALLNQYGATREQMLGLTLADLLFHDLADGRRIVAQLLDQGHLHVETEELRFDGTRIVVEGHYVCIYDAQRRITGHFGVQRDITERKRREAIALQRRHQLQQQQLVILELSQRQELYTGDLATALDTVTQTAAHTLHLEWVSIWWRQPGTSTLDMACVSRFSLSQNCHSAGLNLVAANYPHYFESITQHRILVVEDVLHDPRVQEWVESYLRPQGIVSMMDVPIRSEGALMGLICFEQVGTPRHWLLEEQHFAAYLANMVALIYEVGHRKQAEAALRLREQEFRTLTENTPDFVMRCDRQFRFLYVNPAVTQQTALSAATMVGKTSQELGFPKSLVDLWHGGMAQVLATGQEHTLEYTMTLARGDFTYSSRVVPETDATGDVISLLIVSRDITDLKRAQAELLAQSQREYTLRLITQHIRETLDLDIILTQAVEQVQHAFQADRTLIFRFNSDHSGIVIREVVRPDFPSTLEKRWEYEDFPLECYADYARGMARIVDDNDLAGCAACPTKFMQTTGMQSRIVAPILQGQEDGGTRVWGLLMTQAYATPRQWRPDELDLLQQVAEQLAIALHQAELLQQLQSVNQELENLTNTDALTQVANRRYFDHALAQEWQRAQRDRSPLTLLLCDIDFFKQYNDTHGHPAGDVCLVAVAQALASCLKRSSDCLARYGGEEFAIILPNTDRRGAQALVSRLQRAIAALELPPAAHVEAPRMTLSFGVAIALPDRPLTPQDLVEWADQALYRAKQTGRNRLCLALAPPDRATNPQIDCLPSPDLSSPSP
jgi:diguanylate cyclase (GGDEF)-like protein/PAS domain S-box-containing protein